MRGAGAAPGRGWGGASRPRGAERDRGGDVGAGGDVEAGAAACSG